VVQLTQNTIVTHKTSLKHIDYMRNKALHLEYGELENEIFNTEPNIELLVKACKYFNILENPHNCIFHLLNGKVIPTQRCVDSLVYADPRKHGLNMTWGKHRMMIDLLFEYGAPDENDIKRLLKMSDAKDELEYETFMSNAQKNVDFYDEY